MTKQIAIQSENISYLAEEIKAILSQARDSATITMISAKYMVGDAVFTSPLYKKNAKGQLDLYESIARETGMRPDTISDCVKFYREYPEKNPKQLAEKLYLEHGSWRNIRLVLYGGVSNSIRSGLMCRHCPIHYPELCP